jgi:ribonuclease BN (tRNA processing enzyme)
MHDSQYFEHEYPNHVGWGHSSVADAVAFAQAVGARGLMLFHHEPRHTDDSLERLEDRARSLFGRNGDQPTLAREGMVVELP